MIQPISAMPLSASPDTASIRPRSSWGEPWLVHGPLGDAPARDAGNGAAGMHDAVHRFAMPAGLLQSVVALATAHGESGFVALLAAYALLCRRDGASDEVLIGSPVLGGRVWRADLSGDPSFEELLARVGDAVDHPDGLPPAARSEALGGLSLSWQATAEALVGSLQYDARRYDAAAIQALADRYLELLAAIVAQPARNLSRVAA